MVCYLVVDNYSFVFAFVEKQVAVDYADIIERIHPGTMVIDEIPEHRRGEVEVTNVYDSFSELNSMIVSWIREQTSKIDLVKTMYRDLHQKARR